MLYRYRVGADQVCDDYEPLEPDGAVDYTSDDNYPED